MPNFNYTRDIPDGPDNPSDDQPPMKENTNSTDSIIKEDHYGFNDNNGGLHKQTRMPILAAQPLGLPADGGTLYVKDAETTLGTNRGQLFFATDNVAAASNEFQITRAIPLYFSTFGTIAPYTVGPFPPATFTANSGWTFLPGGLILQYGTYSKIGALGGAGAITFPFNFSSAVFNVTLTLQRSASGTNPHDVYLVGNPSTSGFIFASNSTGSDILYWTAIGK